MRGTTLFIVVLVILIIVAACSPASTAPPDGTSVELAPPSALSPELRRLSPEVQEAYRFALANRDSLERIPCCCGCGTIGHMSTYMCYIRPESAGGEVVFDHHGAG